MEVKDSETIDEHHDAAVAQDNEAKNNDGTESDLDVGSLLVEARENMGLTTLNIAEALNLNPEIIEKIESNTFTQELPLAFIRGYVKSYATKVGLEVPPILSTFDKVTGVESPSLKSVQSIASFDTKPKEFNANSSAFKLISALVVLMFLTFLGWKGWKNYLEPTFFSEHSLQQDASNSIELQLGESNQNEPIASTDNSPIVESEAVNASPLPTTELAQDDSKVIGLAANQSIGIDDTPVGSSGEVQAVIKVTSIDMSFTADCWVKVTDANGEVLALGVKQNGKRMVLKGAEPIEVILGDASAVSINFDGQPIDLSGYRAGRRVELVLEN